MAWGNRVLSEVSLNGNLPTTSIYSLLLCRIVLILMDLTLMCGNDHFE
jgi:hypothetical protein